MTDKKDAPPKGPERRTPESSGTGTKRPYTTLDLKATEVSSPASKGKEQPKQTARPAATGAGAATESLPPSGQENTGGSEAAAARIAAAAANLRQGPIRASTGESRSAHVNRTYSGPSVPSDNADNETSGVTGMRSYATHLAAGVLGGLVAVLGSQLFVSSKVAAPPAAGDTALRDVQQKLAALEKSAVERPAAPRPSGATQRLEAIEAGLAQLDGINRSLGALREAQAKLSAQANALDTSPQRPPVDRDAAGRLDKIEEQLTTLTAAASADPQAGARIGQMAQVTAKIGELELAATTRLEALRKELSQEMEARAAGIAEASETAKSVAQRLEREMAGAKSEATRVSQRVEVLRAGDDRMEQSLRALQADAGTLNAALERLRSENEARLANTAKVADITSAVEPVAAKIAAPAATVATTITATGLLVLVAPITPIARTASPLGSALR